MSPPSHKHRWRKTQQKQIANITVNGEILEAFSRTRSGGSQSPLLFNIVLEVLADVVHPENERIRETMIGKGKI